MLPAPSSELGELGAQGSQAWSPCEAPGSFSPTGSLCRDLKALQWSASEVLWKPPGWSVDGDSKDLKTWLQEHFHAAPIVYDAGVTYGLVHRLDRRSGQWPVACL